MSRASKPCWLCVPPPLLKSVATSQKSIQNSLEKRNNTHCVLFFFPQAWKKLVTLEAQTGSRVVKYNFCRATHLLHKIGNFLSIVTAYFFLLDLKVVVWLGFLIPVTCDGYGYLTVIWITGNRETMRLYSATSNFAEFCFPSSLVDTVISCCRLAQSIVSLSAWTVCTREWSLMRKLTMFYR